MNSLFQWFSERPLMAFAFLFAIALIIMVLTSKIAIRIRMDGLEFDKPTNRRGKTKAVNIRELFPYIGVLIITVFFVALSKWYKEGEFSYHVKKEEWVGDWLIKMENKEAINFATETNGIMHISLNDNDDLTVIANIEGDIKLDNFKSLGSYGNILGYRKEKNVNKYPYEFFMSGQERRVFMGRYKDGSCRNMNDWKMIIGYRR